MKIKVRLKDMPKILSEVFDVFYTGTHQGEGAANNAAALTDMGDTRKNVAFNFNDDVIGKRIYNLTDGSSGIITAITGNTITATLAGGSDNDWDLKDVYMIGYRVLNVHQAGYTVIGDGTKVITTAGTRVALSATSVPCKKVDITNKFASTGVVCIGGATVVAAESTRRGTPILPGTTYPMFISNLNLVWLDSVNSLDEVVFTYFN